MSPTDVSPNTEAPAADLPPGFDAAWYLLANPDVAAAPDPEAHYRDYGRAELRALMPEGRALAHPESRLLDGDDRFDWQNALRRRAEAAGSVMALLDSHPRSAWLHVGFALSAYLQQCQDVAAAVSDPLEAAFHYLEFGLEEARMGRPEDWNAGFVEARYGLKPEAALRPIDVLAQVLALDVSPLDAALDEPQYWELAGLAGAALSRIFDHEYYHARACFAGMKPVSHDRIDCIDHFLTTGLPAGLPLHPDHVFAPEFYAATLAPAQREALLGEAGTQGPDEQALRLYTDWLQRGLREGLSANPRAWTQAEFGIDLPAEIDTQIAAYALAAKLDADMPSHEILEHMLTSPRPGFATLVLSDGPGVEFAAALADDLVIRGDEEQGAWLYWQALSRNPHHGRALRHLSDILQRQNKLEVAHSLRGQVPDVQDTAWNILAQAEIALTERRFDGAAKHLTRLPAKSLSEVAIAAKKRALAQQLFYAIWDNIGPHVAAYGIARTQDQLRAAMAVCTPDFSTAARSRPIKRIALLGNEDLYQCKLYRVDQKAEQLREMGLEVTVLSPSHDLDGFRARIDDFDAAIFFRVPAFPPMIEAMAQAANHGLLTFYEIDDVVFDTAHFPPPLETYAGQITPAQYAAMACGVPLFEHAMSLCDYGIASTATIASLMAPRVRTGQVFEHHNALGRLHMTALKAPPVMRMSDAPLVIFYGSGTRAHKEDFHDILEPALAEMLRRHPGKIEIRLIGYFSDFRHLDLASDPVTILEPVWDFEEFMTRVAQADINLSVLVPTPLTDAKSEIKWMEAAMFAIPSIVSDTATHREVIEDGETGFLAASTDDFTAALDRLISDAALRGKVGQAAQAKVMAEYSLPAMGAGLRSMFESLRPPGRAKKRLMVVNVFYPPQAIGGATRVVYDNVALLREKYGDDYEIDVICTLEGGTQPLEVTTYAHEGARVWAITAPQLKDGDMQPRDGRMGDVFDRLVTRLQPDLIHFHCIQRMTASVVDVARLREIPYVITLHDGWWISPNQFIINDDDAAEYYDYAQRGTDALAPRAQMLSRALSGAAQLLAVSEPFARLHRACGLDNVSVIENGVSPLPDCHRLPSGTGRVRLAHIGGASRHKGVHLVRNALMSASYDNLELLLIDHAMSPSAFRHEVWGTTPVTITGKVPQSEIADLYARVDILLAPSIWPESYGLVTREAAAMGAWVIAGDQGAIGGDVIEDETGHRVDVGSYAGLARVLARIDADPERYRSAPARTPQLRSVEDQVEELAALYAGLLDKAQ